MTPIRVVLADDFALFRRGLASLLADEDGFEVVGEAVDGREALEMSRELMPDLILMDISMPVMDGLEATRRIKAELPYAEIVILTVSDADERLFDAIRCGAVGFFLKDVEPQELFVTLRKIVEGVTPLSRAMAVRLLEEFDRPARDRPGAVSGLTAREREVLARVALGRSDAEIAAELAIAENAVRNHLKNILAKLHLGARAQAATPNSRESPLAPTPTPH